GRATDGRQVGAAVVGADEGLDVGRPGAGRAEVGGDAEVEGGPVEREGGGVQAVGQDRERPANVAGDVAAEAAGGGPAGHQDGDRVGGSQGVAEGGLIVGGDGDRRGPRVEDAQGDAVVVAELRHGLDLGTELVVVGVERDRVRVQNQAGFELFHTQARGPAGGAGAFAGALPGGRSVR